jgi:hypothetical protein
MIVSAVQSIEIRALQAWQRQMLPGNHIYD